jgi:two-component system response regulator RegX3
MRIAILESDRSQACLLQHWLIAAGHVPHRYDGSAELIKDVQSDGFDALLLDWNDLGSRGMDVLSHVRQKMKSSVPVVVITSRTSEEDMVHALQQGADDCIPKPLRHRELLARLESVTRRTRNLALVTQVIEIGRLRLNVAARRVYVDSVAIEMSAKDFDLAVFLLSNVGRFLSRAHITEAVWGHKTLLRSRTLDTHTSRVRTKLCLTEPNGWRLLAVYGHGYRLERFTPRPKAIRRLSKEAVG